MANDAYKTTASVTKAELEYMFLGILRREDIFASLINKITADFFDRSLEANFFVLWTAITKIQKKYSQTVLFNQTPGAIATLLKTEIAAFLNRTSFTNTPVIASYLFGSANSPGYIDWVYSLDPSQIIPNHVYDIATRLILHRGIQAKLQSCLTLAGNKVLQNLPELLSSFVEESKAVSNISTNRVKSAVLSDWQPKPSPKFSTGVSFMDRMLRGGHAPGEVFSILGGYASGKTLFNVQLACQSAMRSVIQHQKDPTQPIKHSYIFHYEATYDEIMARVVSHICRISWEELQDYDFSKLSSLNGPVPPKEYELKIWHEEIKRQTGTFMPEKERMEFGMNLYGPYIHPVDMSGTDPDSPKSGCGYVDEIAAILRREVEEKGVEIGYVGIDYAGLCCKRYMLEKGLKPEVLRHLLGGFGEACRRSIAIPLKCPVWVMHQLAAAANKKTHATLQHHSDAAEAKNFGENMVSCFEFSTPHPAFKTVILSTSKSRRNLPTPPAFLYINGRFQRIEDARQYFDYDSRSGLVIPKAEARAFGVVNESELADFSDYYYMSEGNETAIDQGALINTESQLLE